MKQEQFLNLASAEEALKRFRDAVNPAPLGEEQILLKEARGRVRGDGDHAGDHEQRAEGLPDPV